MSTIMRTLSGVSDEISFGSGGSKLKSNSDGIMQLTNNAGTLGKLVIADGTASDHAISKSQLDAIVAGAPALLDTLNELAAAINDDEDYASTVSALIAELNTDITDAVGALGVAENTSNMGTFTGSIISDNGTAKAALQELETSTELRATAADAALTGTATAEALNATGNISADQFHAKGTGHLHFTATGNDAFFKLSNEETLQITRSNAAGNPTTFTAGGGSKDFVFNQNTDFGAGIDVTGSISVTGSVDGRDIAADGTALDANKLRYVVVNYDDTSADFGAELPSGTFIEVVSVKITTAFSGGSSPALTVGSSADATGFASISTSDLGSAQRILSNNATYAGTVLASNVQPLYSLSGSPTAGSATVAILCRGS